MSNSCPSVMNQMDFFSSETSSSFKVLNSMEKFVISTPKSHPLLFSSVNVFIFSTAEQPGYTMKSPQLIFEIAVLLPSMNVFYLSYTLLDLVLLSGKHLPFGATFATNVVTNLWTLTDALQVLETAGIDTIPITPQSPPFVQTFIASFIADPLFDPILPSITP